MPQQCWHETQQPEKGEKQDQGDPNPVATSRKGAQHWRDAQTEGDAGHCAPWIRIKADQKTFQKLHVCSRIGQSLPRGRIAINSRRIDKASCSGPVTLKTPTATATYIARQIGADTTNLVSC